MFNNDADAEAGNLGDQLFKATRHIHTDIFNYTGQF